MTKRKEERRELLKQDEFLTRMERAIRYSQDHASRVMMLVAAGIVVVGLIFGLQAFRSHQDHQAAQVLYKGEKILLTEADDPQAELKFEDEKAKNEAALAELEKAISSTTGEIQAQARVRAIGCLVALGRNEDTLAHYEALSKSNGIYASLGYMGLGEYYRAKKDYAKALQAFNDCFNTLSGTDGLADLLKYRIAMTYKDQGDTAKAIQELEVLINKYAEDTSKQPTFYSKAKTLLDDLKKET
ncbi:MAG: hypothetical protein H6510_03860 [Acidobacteria bacterium]|nr:hypothetical protein [Acidobacteriota bacterium]